MSSSQKQQSVKGHRHGTELYSWPIVGAGGVFEARLRSNQWGSIDCQATPSHTNLSVLRATRTGIPISSTPITGEQQILTFRDCRSAFRFRNPAKSVCPPIGSSILAENAAWIFAEHFAHEFDHNRMHGVDLQRRSVFTGVADWWRGRPSRGAPPPRPRHPTASNSKQSIQRKRPEEMNSSGLLVTAR